MGARVKLVVLAATVCGVLLVCCAGALAAWGTGVEATLPANAGPNQGITLGSLSCASAGNCTAVGRYHDSSYNLQGLLLTETAGAWATGVEATLPANAGPNPVVSLHSVSCASAGNCTAVGNYEDSSGNVQGLLLSETAGAWATGVEPTLPANAGSPPQITLTSVGLVSCASAGNCTAVGIYTDSSGNQQYLLLSETAGAWARGVEATLPANAGPNHDVGLKSLSCASAGNCTAVGNYVDSSGNTQGLLLSETAGVWATGVEATLPANASSEQDVNVTSVSCASAGNCTAVGNYSDSSYNPQGLLLRETAGAWATGVEATLPANANSTEYNQDVLIDSVSCASAGNCTAVGSYDDSSGNRQGLLLSETAGAWAPGVQATLPANAGSPTDVGLNSVSCVSAGNCTAVGSYDDGSYNQQGLLLSETVGAWATGVEATLPANAGPDPTVSLTSVSCASAGNCTAVGGYDDSSGNEQGLLISSTTPSTSLTAAPQIARHGAVGLDVASATLTSGGTALSGQTITFTDGSLQLCTATTNAKGTATCLVPLKDEILVLLTNKYTATYTATPNYTGSTATTPAIIL
jgi:hypothetical protein